MFIQNIGGTSDNEVPNGYSSWLDYWEKNSHKSVPYRCPSCRSIANLVGAHVRKSYSNDYKWYIVPLCQKCNMSSGTLNVDENLLVHANKNNL